MTLCPPCRDLYYRWLDYTPPAYQNRYVQTWAEAASGTLGPRSIEALRANREARDKLVRQQLDAIVATCKTRHQEGTDQ